MDQFMCSRFGKARDAIGMIFNFFDFREILIKHGDGKMYPSRTAINLRKAIDFHNRFRPMGVHNYAPGCMCKVCIQWKT